MRTLMHTSKIWTKNSVTPFQYTNWCNHSKRKGHESTEKRPRNPETGSLSNTHHEPDIDLIAVRQEREVLREKIVDLTKKNERERSDLEAKLQQMKHKLDAKVQVYVGNVRNARHRLYWFRLHVKDTRM